MSTERLGIVINGATGGVANRQHLGSALAPIIREGGLKIGDRTIMPDLLLVGRDETRLGETAERFGLSRWTTDLSAAIADSDYPVVFDAGFTGARQGVLKAAIEAGKHVYSEKPVVTDADQAAELRDLLARHGGKFAVVEDKLFLPGMTKLRMAKEAGFLGRVVNFRLDFGLWVFSHREGELQRPSWNYRKSGGGGLFLDMYPHWRYVVEGIVGPIRRVVTAGWTALPDRIGEDGKPYVCDVDDSTAALVELESGAFGTITCSWATRVRQEDILLFQVDGTEGSAVAGAHRCHVQSLAGTPRLAIDYNRDLGVDYRADWQAAPFDPPFTNGYRMGWEAFIRHVTADGEPVAGLEAGLRDVGLAKAAEASAAERQWVPIDRFV